MPLLEYTDYNSGQLRAEVDRFPDVCPVCEKGNEFKPLYAFGKKDRYDDDVRLQVMFRCPRQACQILFFVFYNNPYGRGIRYQTKMYYLQKFALTSYIEPIRFAEEIDKISPKFSQIYNQSFFAEENGLNEICGAGYKRALEFLIKDYLMYLNPRGSDEIKAETHLSKLIAKIDDGDIQLVANRAAWLANDESHYLKVWEDKDILNLKDLIELTVSHVKRAEMTKKYQKEMPKPKKVGNPLK